MKDSKIKTMNELLAIQGQCVGEEYDPYMLGMYNGMELIISMVEDREPKFMEAPPNAVYCHINNKLTE